MWFSADCTWKLIDLKGASMAGDWTVVDAAVGKYSAPEIRYAERLGRQRVHLDPPADMWSFGVIALETLTGKPFTLSFCESISGGLIQGGPFWMPAVSRSASSTTSGPPTWTPTATTGGSSPTQAVDTGAATSSGTTDLFGSSSAGARSTEARRRMRSETSCFET